MQRVGCDNFGNILNKYKIIIIEFGFCATFHNLRSGAVSVLLGFELL